MIRTIKSCSGSTGGGVFVAGLVYSFTIHGFCLVLDDIVKIRGLRASLKKFLLSLLT